MNRDCPLASKAGLSGLVLGILLGRVLGWTQVQGSNARSNGISQLCRCFPCSECIPAAARPLVDWVQRSDVGDGRTTRFEQQFGSSCSARAGRSGACNRRRSWCSAPADCRFRRHRDCRASEPRGEFGNHRRGFS